MIECGEDTGPSGTESHRWIADVLGDVLAYARKNGLAEVSETLDEPYQEIERILRRDQLDPVTVLPIAARLSR